MKFNKIYENYMSTLLTEDKNDIVAIYPGGFKPPHIGHYQLVEAYAADPNIREVKILLGPKERADKSGGIRITEEMSRKVWTDYYIPTLPGSVSIIEAPDPVPVRASYVYVGEVAESNEWITLMSSVKDAKDAQRAKEFAEKHHPGTGKYHRPDVTVVYYPKDVVAYYNNREDGQNNQPVSASTMREDIAHMDLKHFITNLPEKVRDKGEELLNIFNPQGTMGDYFDLS